MYQDMHVTNSWEFTEPMAVKAIYKLFTEGDYAVNHRIIVPDKYFYIYTMEGVGTFVVDDDQLVVSANSLVVVNAKRGLHYHCSGPKWNFWLVEFKTAHPRLIPNKVYPLALGKTVLSQFAVALQEFKQEHIQSAAALFQFIYYASARLAEERQGKQTRRLLNAALAYMQENLRNFSVAELCRYLNVEERTLRNIFMRKLNTSPKSILSICAWRNRSGIWRPPPCRCRSSPPIWALPTPVTFPQRFAGNTGRRPSSTVWRSTTACT